MDKFIVGPSAARPVGKLEVCFYCNQPIGGEHKPDCVCVVRKIRVRVSVEMDIWRPASWKEGDVGFDLEGSSWCATNIIDELQEYADSKEPGCLCSDFDFEILQMLDEKKVRNG